MGVRWLPVVKRVSKSRDIALHVFVTWNYIRLPLSRHHKKVFLQHASLPRASIPLFQNPAFQTKNLPKNDFALAKSNPCDKPSISFFYQLPSPTKNLPKKEIPLGISNPCDNLYVHIHIRWHASSVFHFCTTLRYQLHLR